ncbi:MAG: gliding motility-associated C-terminal domain-containing protein [Bacteroidota bacterium]
MLKFTRIVLLLAVISLYSFARYDSHGLTIKPAAALNHHDPDDCLKIAATILNAGNSATEGSASPYIYIKFKLPPECPAAEDIVISTQMLNPQNNNGDYTMPTTVTFKKGDTEADLTITILDDQIIEGTEFNTIKLTAGPTLNGYKLDPTTQLTFAIADDDNTVANRKFTIIYTPEITEGSQGNIKVALPPGITLTEPLEFTFAPDNNTYQATPTADYTSLLSAIVIPAGQNSVTLNINAFADGIIEGDEFVSGVLKPPVITTFGTFTSDDNKVMIRLIDGDNTVEKRIIEITPDDDILNESSNNTYTFRLYQPSPDPSKKLKLSTPLNITVTEAQRISFIGSTSNAIVLDENMADYTSLTLSYPDDNVIRPDQPITMTPLADDLHTGPFLFRWKGVIIDAMHITAIDNDAELVGLKISPTSLTIREGNTAGITVEVNGGSTFNNDISINYTWSGIDIDNENRIADKTGTVILPKGQSKITLPVFILDDQLLNPNDKRTINFTALDYQSKPVTLFPQNTVAVTLIDDDFTTLTIPNTFTPNGDGINDTWNIVNLGFDSQCTVQIFNRYGNVIYNSVGYPAAWGGTSRGQNVATGTYYYMINTHGKTYSGSVTVIR